MTHCEPKWGLHLFLSVVKAFGYFVSHDFSYAVKVQPEANRVVLDVDIPHFSHIPAHEAWRSREVYNFDIVHSIGYVEAEPESPVEDPESAAKVYNMQI